MWGVDRGGGGDRDKKRDADNDYDDNNEGDDTHLHTPTNEIDTEAKAHVQYRPPLDRCNNQTGRDDDNDLDGK